MLRPLPLLVVALVASAAVAAPRPKEAGKGPVYQPAAVGTKWVYDDGGKDWAEEIVGAEAKDGETILTVKLKSFQGESDKTVAVSAGGVFSRGFGRFTYDMCLLKLPVRAEQTWEVSIAPQKGLLDYAGTMTVGVAETVEVPAGTFRAVPVRLAQTSRKGKKLDTPDITTWWWAEGVGVVRLQSGATDRKLKSFIPAKKD